MNIPNRASDTGPDTCAEEPMTWLDMLEAAENEIRDARRLYRDDPALELKLRIEAIREARRSIDEALEFLEFGVLHVNQQEVRRLQSLEVA